MSKLDSIQEKIKQLPYPGKQDLLKLREYRQTLQTLEKEWCSQCLIDAGIAENPKAPMLMAIAWTLGHANGYTDVKILVGTLLPLIEEDS